MAASNVPASVFSHHVPDPPGHIERALRLTGQRSRAPRKRNYADVAVQSILKEFSKNCKRIDGRPSTDLTAAVRSFRLSVEHEYEMTGSSPFAWRLCDEVGDGSRDGTRCRAKLCPYCYALRVNETKLKVLAMLKALDEATGRCEPSFAIRVGCVTNINAVVPTGEINPQRCHLDKAIREAVGVLRTQVASNLKVLPVRGMVIVRLRSVAMMDVKTCVFRLEAWLIGHGPVIPTAAYSRQLKRIRIRSTIGDRERFLLSILKYPPSLAAVPALLPVFQSGLKGVHDVRAHAARRRPQPPSAVWRSLGEPHADLADALGFPADSDHRRTRGAFETVFATMGGLIVNEHFTHAVDFCDAAERCLKPRHWGDGTVFRIAGRWYALLRAKVADEFQHRGNSAYYVTQSGNEEWRAYEMTSPVPIQFWRGRAAQELRFGRLLPSVEHVHMAVGVGAAMHFVGQLMGPGTREESNADNGRMRDRLFERIARRTSQTRKDYYAFLRGSSGYYDPVFDMFGIRIQLFLRRADSKLDEFCNWPNRPILSWLHSRNRPFRQTHRIDALYLPCALRQSKGTSALFLRRELPGLQSPPDRPKKKVMAVLRGEDRVGPYCYYLERFGTFVQRLRDRRGIPYGKSIPDWWIPRKQVATWRETRNAER